MMLNSVLSEEEFRSIPEHTASKIEKALNENSEQYMTIKALYETCKRDHGRNMVCILLISVFSAQYSLIC